jgi:hypothetical protein
MSLDDDLAAWAATVRLPDAEADAMFQRIVRAPVTAAPSPSSPSAAPARLDPSWWRHFSAGFAARMVASNRPVRVAA